MLPLISAPIGLGIGLGISSAIGAYETIQIAGKYDSEIEEVLARLRSKARVPDYQ